MLTLSSFINCLLFPCLALIAATDNDWCISPSRPEPCGGAAGKCTMNEDRSWGGFVADTARIDTFTLKSGDPINIPYLEKYAQICDSAQVIGNAQILGNVRILDYATVGEHAQIFDEAVISGSAQITGKACVFEQAEVTGEARIFENAKIFGEARVGGNALIYGGTHVAARIHIYGNARIAGGIHTLGNHHITKDIRINKSTETLEAERLRLEQNQNQPDVETGIWF